MVKEGYLRNHTPSFWPRIPSLCCRLVKELSTNSTVKGGDDSGKYCENEIKPGIQEIPVILSMSRATSSDVNLTRGEIADMTDLHQENIKKHFLGQQKISPISVEVLESLESLAHRGRSI